MARGTRKFADFDYVAVTLEGSSSEKTDTLKHIAGTSLQVVIVNYESAWRLEKELLKFKADIVVADEGHKIKTNNTRQSKAMHKIGASAKYRMLLTGTVITNKAIDVFSQYKFVNPLVFGQSFSVFKNKFFNMTGYGNHTPVLKRHMEQELMDKLHSIAFRVTKAECLDLPEITDVMRYVVLEPGAMRVYKDLVRDSFAELSKGEVSVTNILTKLLRLSQLTGGFIGNDEGSAPQRISTAKLNVLEDIIDGALNEGRKLVVIARFIAEIKAICKLIESKKECINGTMQPVKYSLIMGGVKDREVQVSQFQNNPEVQVFVDK